MRQGMAKTADIKPDPNQHRQQKNPAEQERLNQSVAQHGILQPLGVRPNGTLVWGHSRLIAAIAAGLKEVPVVILEKPMTEGEYLTYSVIENMLRFDLSQHDRWRACVRLLEANPGWQNVDLAKALSMDASMVTRLLSPSKCTAEWQEALKNGIVGLSDCYAASKLPGASEQTGMLALKLSGASRDAIEKVGRNQRNGVVRKKASGAKRVRRVSLLKCPIPGSNVIVQVTGQAPMSLGEVIAAVQEWLTRASHANDQGWDCKAMEKACKKELNGTD